MKRFRKSSGSPFSRPCRRRGDESQQGILRVPLDVSLRSFMLQFFCLSFLDILQFTCSLWALVADLFPCGDLRNLVRVALLTPASIQRTQPQPVFLSPPCSPYSCSLVTRTFGGGQLSPSSRNDPAEKMSSSSGSSSNSGLPGSMPLQEGEPGSEGGCGCPLFLSALLCSQEAAPGRSTHLRPYLLGSPLGITWGFLFCSESFALPNQPSLLKPQTLQLFFPPGSCILVLPSQAPPMQSVELGWGRNGVGLYLAGNHCLGPASERSPQTLPSMQTEITL